MENSQKTVKYAQKEQKTKMDNKKAKKAIAFYMCLWYNIIVPRERITKAQRKKIQENFQKGLDKFLNLWYNKSVPREGTKILRSGSRP